MSTGRSAGNSGERPVSFRLRDAERIAKAVSEVEGRRRPRNASRLPRAAGSGGSAIGTFSGVWPIGSEKSVTVDGVTTLITNYTFYIPEGGVRTAVISGSALVAVRCY